MAPREREHARSALGRRGHGHDHDHDHDEF
jgi:hypothetical protein